MINRIRSLLTAPTFDDEEKTLTARLLYALFGLVIGVTLILTFPLSLLLPEGGLAIAAQGLAGILICGFLYTLVRRGFVRLAAYLLVGLFWALNTITVITSGGIEANAFSNFMVIIFTAGLLLGARAGAVITLLCVLVGVGVVLADQYGLLPPSVVEQTPFTLLFSNVALFTLVVILQGVSARITRQALRRARASERQFRSLLESTPAITYINGLGPENPTTYISPQVQHLVGYPREAFLEDPVLWAKLIHPADRARFDAENEATNASGEPMIIDYRLMTLDGRVVWVHDEAVLVRDRDLSTNPDGESQYWLGVWTDITDRKQTETALAQERDLLQALMDNIPDMIYFKDDASRFIRINRAQADFLGVDQLAQAIGKTDLDFHPTQLAQMFFEEEQQMMETGEPVIHQLEFNPSPEDQPRWISATKVPMRNQEGKIVGLVGISRDVTDREIVLQTIINQANQLATVGRVSTAVSTILVPSELLQTIVELTKDSFELYHAQIYLLSEDGVNLTIAAGTGEAGWKMRARGWTIPLSHEKSIVARVARAQIGALINNVQQPPAFLPNPLLPNTHSELAVPILVGDQLLGVFDLQSEQPGAFTENDLQVYTAFAQQMAVALQNARRYELARIEIVERKRAELQIKQYADIVNNMQIGMYILQAAELEDDTSFRIVAANPTALFHSGKTLEDVLDQPMDQVLKTLRLKGFPQKYLQVLKTGIPVELEDVYFDQNNILNEAYAVKAFSLSSDMVGILFENILERKRAEVQLQRFNVELETHVRQRTAQFEAANKELEAFSYTVSHDLRAPVRAMAGFSSILLEEYAPQMPPEALSHLQHIRAGAQRMGQLVDGLLTFTRLGRQAITRQRVDAATLARQVYDELIEIQQGRQVTILIDSLPPCEADPALLRQVFSHLLDNALKYTQTEPAPTIEVGHLEQNGEPVYFVRDNGIGFEMRYAHKLFRVFEQLHLPGEYKGTGIGLALIRRIIEKHGGRIWAEAEPGRGATFFFTLPYSETLPYSKALPQPGD